MRTATVSATQWKLDRLRGSVLGLSSIQSLKLSLTSVHLAIYGILICAEYPDAEREKLLLLVIPKSPKLSMLKKNRH